MNIEDKKDQDFALSVVKNRRLFEDTPARSSCGLDWQSKIPFLILVHQQAIHPGWLSDAFIL